MAPLAPPLFGLPHIIVVLLGMSPAELTPAAGLTKELPLFALFDRMFDGAKQCSWARGIDAPLEMLKFMPAATGATTPVSGLEELLA